MKTEMIVELKGAMVAALMIGLLLAFGCGGDAGDDTTDADAGEGDVPGTDGEEAGEVEEAHDDSEDVGEEEEIEETGPPIGDPCVSDDDCGEGTCLTWLPGCPMPTTSTSACNGGNESRGEKSAESGPGMTDNRRGERDFFAPGRHPAR